MPKESTGQKRTMERVMHEYKHDELKAGQGRHSKVKSRKQAVAIGMKEAGTSKYGTSSSRSKSSTGAKSRRSPGRPRKASRARK